MLIIVIVHFALGGLKSHMLEEQITGMRWAMRKSRRTRGLSSHRELRWMAWLSTLIGSEVGLL